MWVITKKPSKIVKFTKIHHTLYATKEEPINLVVPPTLLKQENVCLISREAEHPSNPEIYENYYMTGILPM